MSCGFNCLIINDSFIKRASYNSIILSYKQACHVIFFDPLFMTKKNVIFDVIIAKLLSFIVKFFLSCLVSMIVILPSTSVRPQGWGERKANSKYIMPANESYSCSILKVGIYIYVYLRLLLHIQHCLLLKIKTTCIPTLVKNDIAKSFQLLHLPS